MTETSCGLVFMNGTGQVFKVESFYFLFRLNFVVYVQICQTGSNN